MMESVAARYMQVGEAAYSECVSLDAMNAETQRLSSRCDGFSKDAIQSRLLSPVAGKDVVEEA